MTTRVSCGPLKGTEKAIQWPLQGCPYCATTLPGARLLASFNRCRGSLTFSNTDFKRKQVLKEQLCARNRCALGATHRQTSRAHARHFVLPLYLNCVS